MWISNNATTGNENKLHVVEYSSYFATFEEKTILGT
jgi:hypothetical protein